MQFVLIAAIATVAATQPELGKQLNERALEEMARGDQDAARRDLTVALAIWQSLGPDFRPHAVIGMLNLGDVLCAMGDWAGSAALFERALALNRAGDPHGIRTMAAMNRLANVYVVQGRRREAEALYREALTIEREFQPRDLQTAHTLIGLSSLESRDQKPDEALALGEEGLELTLQVAGENQVEAAMAYSNVGQIHRVAGRTDRAIPLLRKARSIFERTLGPNHPRVASVLSQEGLALLQDGKLSLADTTLTHAVELLEQSHANNVETAVAKHNLGMLRLRQRRYREADALLSDALSLERQYSAQPSGEMAATLQMLSDVREKEHRPADAAKLKQQAAAIQSYR